VKVLRGGLVVSYVDDDFEYDERIHGDLLHADDAYALVVDVGYAVNEVHNNEYSVRHCGMSTTNFNL
jgi:hypothetical protein